MQAQEQTGRGLECGGPTRCQVPRCSRHGSELPRQAQGALVLLDVMSSSPAPAPPLTGPPPGSHPLSGRWAPPVRAHSKTAPSTAAPTRCGRSSQCPASPPPHCRPCRCLLHPGAGPAGGAAAAAAAAAAAGIAGSCLHHPRRRLLLLCSPLPHRHHCPHSLHNRSRVSPQAMQSVREMKASQEGAGAPWRVPWPGASGSRRPHLGWHLPLPLHPS